MTSREKVRASTGRHSSPEVFPVNRSLLPGSAEARRMTVSSGRRCFESSKTSGPLGLLEKTLMESDRWNSTIVLLTWKPVATPAGRSVFQLTVSKPDTRVTESLSWRTPNTMDALPIKSQAALDHEHTTARPGRSEPNNLRDQIAVREGLRTWNTPTALYGHNTGTFREWGGQGNKSRGTPEASGKVNPDWEEWLMGIPPNWTRLSDSIAATFLEKPSCRTKCFRYLKPSPESNGVK